MNILVPNLGSTSLKYQLVQMPSERVLAQGRLERVTNYEHALAQIDTGSATIDAVAFKTVHGGPRYRGTYRIDADVLNALRQFLPAAPAHNSVYLTAIEAFRAVMPDTPLVAAFETEFHVTIPEHAAHYGVPRQWHDEHGIRRYGFHGASHRYVAERVREILGRPVRLVSSHLGGSSSLCAIDKGHSIDTTMGFSLQSGIENATRSGELDAFAILYLLKMHGWSPERVSDRLTTCGGLAGISGIEGGDIRDVQRAAASGDADAELALRVLAYQIRKTIGAYAAAMGGIDALAFTGGMGENSPALREACCEGLQFLGITLDPTRNRHGAGDRMLSPDEAPVAVLALSTKEEVIVARRAYRLLTSPAA